MTDDSPVSRRRVLRTVGIGTAVALAGCLGGGNGSDDGDSSSTESTPNDGGGGSDPNAQTGTGNNNTDPKTGSGNETTPQGSKGGEEDEEDLDLSSLTEDEHLRGEGERISEDSIEKGLSRERDGWIEFEDPNNQIPREKLNVEEYPALEALKDAQIPDYVTDEEITPESGYVGPYRPEDHQATYMSWTEVDGETAMIISVWCGDNSYDRSDNWGSPEGVDSDIEGILEYSVQGVSDVSDLEPRYAEILLELKED